MLAAVGTACAHDGECNINREPAVSVDDPRPLADFSDAVFVANVGSAAREAGDKSDPATVYELRPALMLKGAAAETITAAGPGNSTCAVDGAEAWSRVSTCSSSADRRMAASGTSLRITGFRTGTPLRCGRATLRKTKACCTPWCWPRWRQPNSASTNAPGSNGAKSSAPSPSPTSLTGTESSRCT